MQQLLAIISLVSFCMAYGMGEIRVVKINSLSTSLCIDEKEKEKMALYDLLRCRPLDPFKKIDIWTVVTHRPKDPSSSKRTYFEVKKEGTLETLTVENIDNIHRGYACYHYNIKKQHKHDADMPNGAIAIDTAVRSYVKREWELEDQHKAILEAALKIKKNKKSELEAITQ